MVKHLTTRYLRINTNSNNRSECRLCYILWNGQGQVKLEVSKKLFGDPRHAVVFALPAAHCEVSSSPVPGKSGNVLRYGSPGKYSSHSLAVKFRPTVI